MKTYTSNAKYDAIHINSEEALAEATALVAELIPEDMEMPDLSIYLESNSWAVREPSGVVSIVKDEDFTEHFVEVIDSTENYETFPEHPEA